MKPEEKNVNRWSASTQKDNEALEEARQWRNFRIKFLLPMLGLMIFAFCCLLVLWALGTVIKGLLAPAC